MSEVLGVSRGYYVAVGDDGVRRLYQGIPGFDPQVCGSGPNEIDCNIDVLPLSQAQLAGLSLQQAAELSLAALDAQVYQNLAPIGALGDAALSTLSQTGVARLSPTLAQFTLNPDIDTASAITQLGLGTAITLTGASQQIQAELLASTQQLFSSGELQQFNPDESAPSVFNMYQRYAMALSTGEKYADVVADYREGAMSLLDSFGLGGFDFGSSLPTFNVPQINLSTDYVLNGGFPTTTAPSSSGSGGGFLDILSSIGTTAINNLPSILTGLSNAGIIRGSIGEAFATVQPQQQVTPASVGPMATTLGIATDPCGGIDNLTDFLLCRAEQGIRSMVTPGGAMPTINPNTGLPMYSPAELALAGGRCGGVQPVVQAPTLFRQNGCGGVKAVSRVQVMGPNGAIYVFQNMGRAVRGSNERAVLKRLAKDNGCTVTRRGMTHRRRYRRPR